MSHQLWWIATWDPLGPRWTPDLTWRLRLLGWYLSLFLGRAWALGIRRSVKHPVYQLQITSDVNYWYTNYNVPTLFSLLTNYWPTIYWLYLFIYQEAIPKNNTHHDRKKHFSIWSCWAMSYITTLNNAIETERLRKGYWKGRNGSPLIKWGHRITFGCWWTDTLLRFLNGWMFQRMRNKAKAPAPRTTTRPDSPSRKGLCERLAWQNLDTCCRFIHSPKLLQRVRKMKRVEVFCEENLFLLCVRDVLGGRGDVIRHHGVSPCRCWTVRRDPHFKRGVP